MDFQQAEQAYQNLVNQLNSGSLSAEQFQAGLAALRVQDANGSWWQLNDKGGWLRWDGKQWVASVRTSQSASAAVVNEVVHGVAADAAEFTQKLTFKKFLRFLRQRIVFVALSFAFTWWFHTYLLIVKNDGFNPSGPVSKWINVTGNSPSALAIWGLVSAMLWSLIYSMFTMGPIKAIKAFVMSPVEMVKMIVSAGKEGRGGLLLGAGMALLLSSQIKISSPANFVLAFALSVFGLSQPGWLLARFLSKVWVRAMNALNKQKPTTVTMETLKAAQLLMVGMGPGFLVASFISPNISAMLGVVSLILGAILFFNIQKPKASAGQLSSLLFIGSISALLYALFSLFFREHAYADDGGLPEAGGSVSKWIKSEGAPMAIARGVPPSAASAMGPLAPPLNPVVDPMNIPEGTESGGKIWFRPPWDQGGPSWMDKKEFEYMKEMTGAGYVWTDRYGWKTAADLSEAQRQHEKFVQADREASRTRNEQIQKDMEALKKKQWEESYARKLKIEEMRERQDELERQRKRDNSWSGYVRNVNENFQDNVQKDLETLPEYAYETARAVAKGTRDFVKAAYKEVTDLDNYKAAIQAAGQTVSDLVFHPIESSQKVDKFYRKVGNVGVNVVKAAVNDPVGFTKGVLGVDNWEKAMDPNVPLGERIGRVLYGTVDLAMNVSSGGVAKGADIALEGAKLAKTVDKVADASKLAKTVDKLTDAEKAAKAVDKVADAEKAAKAADKVSDAEKAAKAADKAMDAKKMKELEEARKKAWQAERSAAKKQVDEYKKLITDPKATPEQIEKATLEMQGNKQAVYEMNRRKDDIVTTKFNKKLEEVYDKTDDEVRERLAKEYGVKKDDIKLDKATNVKPGEPPKAPHDRDITARRPANPGELIRDPNAPGGFRRAVGGEPVDIPAKKLEGVYNEEFYKASNAEKHYPGMSKEEFGKKMDQTCTDRLHADAYGSSTKDLETVVGKVDKETKTKITFHDRKLDDVQGVSKTAQFKADEWYRGSDKLRLEGKVGEAETFIAEGNRQLTKQFDNFIKPRVETAGGVVPPNLEKAVNTLRLTEKGVSPATVDKLLSNMGYTRGKVAEQVGGLVEAAQKLAP